MKPSRSHEVFAAALVRLYLKLPSASSRTTRSRLRALDSPISHCQTSLAQIRYFSFPLVLSLTVTTRAWSWNSSLANSATVAYRAQVSLAFVRLEGRPKPVPFVPVRCGGGTGRGSRSHTLTLLATSIKNTSPSSSNASVNCRLLPYTSSPPTHSKRKPRSRAFLTISKASWALVQWRRSASGTFALAQRSGSCAHCSGRNKRKSTSAERSWQLRQEPAQVCFRMGTAVLSSHDEEFAETLTELHEASCHTA